MDIATDTASDTNHVYAQVFDFITSEGFATLAQISAKVGKEEKVTRMLVNDLFNRHGQIVILEDGFYSLVPGRPLAQGGANKVLGKLVTKEGGKIKVRPGSGF